MKDDIFIISTGRAGTTFLSSKILELGLITDNLHQDKYSRKLNILSNAAMKFPFLKKVIIKKINSNPEILKSKIDPLKSMTFSIYLEHLKENDPEKYKRIIIIHLVRDPRTFVTSFMNWKNRKLSGRIAHHIIPFWMPKPISNGLFRNFLMTKFEHYCWTWTIKNELFYNTFSSHSNYQLVRFEDMISNQLILKNLIKKVVGTDEDFKLKDPKQKINQSTLKSFPHWSDWSDSRALILNEICGNFMKKLDYGNEEKWKDKLNNGK